MASHGKSKGQIFGFDLSKPMKRGILLKQGAFHKAFKYRYFVLYPGFLVYYGEQAKWSLDVTRGDTLQSRQGAIKLKNGTCNVCKQPPKGCKFGFVIHAPDPNNNRQTYLINATSKEEREVWIQAIRQAIPHSPKPARKNNKEPNTIDNNKEHMIKPPEFTQRQETVDVAAKVASETTSEIVEDSITSIDQELREPEPSLAIRRDTTSSAALSVTSDDRMSPIGTLAEEGEPIISIDDVLGPTDDKEESEADLMDKSELKDMECEEIDVQESEGGEMAMEESVSESTNSKGHKEVITTVAVVCNSDSSEIGDNKRVEDGPADKADTPTTTSNSETAKTLNESDTLNTTAQLELSTEVLVPSPEQRHTSAFTINATDPDGDTDDEEGDGTSLGSSLSGDPPIGTGNTEANKSDTPLSPETSCAPAITLNKALSVEETNVEIKENGTTEHSKANGVIPNGECPKLNPKNDSRRPSAAFIQKVGYLYKLGGQRRNWKLRYFVLNPGVFFYYKNPKSTKPLGEVKLKNTRVYFPTAGERKTSYQFVVHTESQWNKRSDWMIAAQSDREMKEWIDAFKAACHKSTPSPSGSPTGSLSDDSS